MDDIENEIEDNQKEDFEIILDQKIENSEKDPEENIKKIIFKDFDKKDITENLVNKTLKVYNTFKLNEKDYGIIIIRSILKQAKAFSKFNLNSRLVDFFDYILSISNLKLEYLEKALDIKAKNLSKQKRDKDKNKDIIFYWKQSIAEDKLKEERFDITSNQMKICLRKLLENNFNINEISYIFLLFKKVIINDTNNSNQINILDCLISILIAYPKFLNEKNEEKRLIKEEELKNFLDKYIIKDAKSNKYIFDENKNVALDFYLKISEDDSSNENLELTIKEIFQYLKINNPEISEMLIDIIDKKMEKIKSIMDNITYKNYDKAKFQNWTKNKLPLFKENNPDDLPAIILGMISLAIKKFRGYYLRNTQLIAILLFIYKKQSQGLIEEISTGEGKSCIISSLAIYFALIGYKVDIISSSYTLAQRDSDEFKELYSYFNLTTDYPYDSNPEPYKSDILYGTFLEFEGDYLREVTSTRKIRNNRSYDVIIIDEVDNLFVDNILGSTRLTNSSRGFKFLIPIYLTVYLSIELSDYFFLLFFKLSLETIENQERKKKFEMLMNNPKERKKEMVNIIQDLLNGILYFDENQNSKNIIDEKKEEEQVEKILKATDYYSDFVKNLQKYMEYPDFLESFVGIASQYWSDSAYDAKNLMEMDRDYVEVITSSGNREIAPVDRANTGEIELSTVYDRGLHQMLEIKHKFRVKDETLVHTFLSHITFFQKYKKNNEFLFFGLTGTIGDEETQNIYGNQYYDSKILFIPQYKKKRFVELPAILVNYNEHFRIICKDIIINFYKGRKILVICNSIKEAKIIENELKKLINIESFGINNNLIEQEDFRESIILYTRSDTEKTNIKEKKKRIILSTNLGGRGTDIQTSIEEEAVGGLHVILTYMPDNYRVLKQAFGRTSREGKKGTAQIILKNIGYNSYSDFKAEMVANEKDHIDYIQKNLDILLFKDKLFEEFIDIIKDIDFNGYLIEDINERWAHFLKVNVTSFDEDINKNVVQKKFEEFKTQIKNILKEDKIYKQFENPFYQMQEGLRRYSKYEKELLDYYTFDSKVNKFYFAQTYIIAIIKIVNMNSFNKSFYEDIIANFDEAIKRTKLVIEENINPVLNSFDQWENNLNNFESALKTDENIRFIENMEKPFLDKSFVISDLCKQYSNIKIICEKIIERIEENKKFMENFKKEYEKDNKIGIEVTEEDLEEGLNLTKEEMKEMPFFSDATFKFVFKLSIRQKKRNLNSLFWILLFLGVITFLAVFAGWMAAGSVAFGLIYYTGVRSYMLYQEGMEISTDSLYGNVFVLILKTVKKFKKSFRDKIEVKNDPLKPNELEKSAKSVLFSEIMVNIENEFKKIEDLKLLKFLIFIDYYYSEDIWTEKIKKIFKDNFDKIYKKNFTQNQAFKKRINQKSYEEHLYNYNVLFNNYLNACIIDINNLGNKKKYNRKDGLNCLEHLIIDLNYEEITEDIADKVIQNMFEYKFFTEDGIINKKLFKECFKDNDGKKLEQNINIHINNKLLNKSLIKNITDTKEFKVSLNKIPLVNASFIDLANFYQIKNYNVEEQLQKDFSKYLIKNLQKIIKYLLNMKPDILNNFYKYSLNLVKNLVKNLLEEKIFSKYNRNTFENIISSELSKEEKEEFRKLIKEATSQAANLFKQ